MIALVKTAHIAGVSVWAAALIGLPFLLAGRGALEDEPLHGLHRAARTVYVGVASPAALVAIAAGIALIFLRETYDPWFTAKLAVVGSLAVLHVRLGRILRHVFDPGIEIPLRTLAASAATSAAATVAILWLVLAKPPLEAPDFGGVLRPGGLAPVAEAALGLVGLPFAPAQSSDDTVRPTP